MTSGRPLGQWAAMIFACLLALIALPAELASQERHRTAVVSFGLFGGQDVFRSEATGAAEVVASRFAADPVIVRFNSRRIADATAVTLAAALKSAASAIDPGTDVLVLILTSHGSPEGLAVSVGRRSSTLSPGKLGSMLDHTGVRYKAVIISACYSGAFIPRLASDDTLVITAADARHPSFGCEDRAKWTYFGDAFFNAGLRRAATLREAFTLARALIAQREASSGFEPSNPQMAGGANVEPLLVARR
jgi:hypothetical protein